MSDYIANVLALWKPLLELVIIWAIIYRLLIFIQGTRTVQLVIGLVMLMLVAALSQIFEFNSINWILTKLFAIGVIAVVIIFQPELRRALARLGQNAALRTFVKKGGVIDEVVKACEHLAQNRIGALIALERDIGLRNYVESGVTTDSKITAELIQTIFMPSTPLHDGGIVIEEDRIASCGSLFPLSQNPQLSKTLGTRHRAGLGLTEETDAVAIIVSEETGKISLSVHGKLKSDLGAIELRRILRSLFKPKKQQNSIFDMWKGFKVGKFR